MYLNIGDFPVNLNEKKRKYDNCEWLASVRNYEKHTTNYPAPRNNQHTIIIHPPASEVSKTPSSNDNRHPK